MIKEIKKEIENAINCRHDVPITLHTIMEILDKYDNQPDYKKMWEELKLYKFARSSKEVSLEYLRYMQELEQKYNLGDKNE